MSKVLNNNILNEILNPILTITTMNCTQKDPRLFLLFISSIILLVSRKKEETNDDANHLTIWHENFETYATNTFPSLWIKDGNASNVSKNFITNSTASEGNKSLMLFGSLGGCWGSIAYRGLETNSSFFIKVDIKNGDESLTGCHPNRAAIVLRKRHFMD